MTKLIVKALDPHEAGSYRMWRNILRLQRELTAGSLDAQEEMLDMVVSRARTDDGSPIEPVLDELSVTDFFTLARGMLSDVEDAVPNASTPNSSDG